MVTCSVGSFAEQVINVPAKHTARLLNSHKLPCLRLCSPSRCKLIISPVPFEVATAARSQSEGPSKQVRWRRDADRERNRRRGSEGECRRGPSSINKRDEVKTKRKVEESKKG